MDIEQLLIPISMKAMLVGEPQDYFANTAYNYSSLDDNPLGDNIEPNLSGVHLDEDKGIHLHWILPDAMKQGQQSDQCDDIIYPSVPNRWNITRLWSNFNNVDYEIHSLSWTVESDALQRESSISNGNLKSPQFPQIDDLNQQYRFLGRSYLSYEVPIPCIEVLEKLTATAPGLPAFAAYYPDCRNVFGFYDNMLDREGKELENINVTYVVCGWYLDSKEDVLSGILSPKECKEKLGWNVPDKFSFPAKSLCHSIMSGIQWVSKKVKYESNIPSSNLELAVGNTTAEALSALVEHKNPSGQNLERMLNLFYSSGDILLKDKNGMIKGENKLHENRFGKENPITQVAFKEGDKEQNNNSKSLPYHKLSEINNHYIELFNKNSELQKLQEQVYDCWYKYGFLGEQIYFDYDEKQKAKMWQNEYIDKIDTLEKDINEKCSKIGELNNKIDREKEELSEGIDNCTFVNQNGQPFWTPNEPVLLLSGVQRDTTYGGDGRYSEDGTLFCRSMSQIITSLTIDKLQGAFDIPTTVNCEDISCTGDIPRVIAPLVKETLIISPEFDLKLAAKILDFRGCRTDSNLKALTEIIKKLQYAQTSKELTLSLGRAKLSKASGFNGVYPEQSAVCQLSKLWSPLFIRWYVSYYSDPAILQDEPTLQNWEMKETLADYFFKGKTLTDKPVVIQGSSILAPNASTITAACSLRNLGDMKLFKAAQNMDVLSQALSGFSGRFIMEKNDISLPVEWVNTNDINLGDTKLPAEKISSLLKGYEASISNFDEFFSPIRGGFMKIDKISIIDSFGQFKEVSNPKVVVAENMRNNQSVDMGNIMLTPRLIQPSRLNFRWLDPDSDIPQDENSTECPICGWFLPNHTDRCIMVYGCGGNLLGSLQRVKLDNPVVWKDTPEKGGGTAPLPENMNLTLHRIISEILDLSYKEHVDMLTPILEVIDSAFWNINPNAAQQFNSLGQYVGRPLIVVNSCLMLEQKYIPKSFKHLETRDNTGLYNSHIDVTKAKFNVQVGRSTNHGDGVIGYFKDSDYKTMHIIADEAPIKHSYFNTENFVTLATGDKAPSKLTILMDFTASVDLISGFLPTKTIKPHDQAINEALNKLYFTIFLAPVLGDIEEFAIPHPQLDGRHWKWLHYINSYIKEDEISNTTEQAYFPKTGVCAEEGWLKLMLREDPENKK